MLAKDTVARRLNSEDGISFTEFSYQVLQGNDYLHLFDEYHCTLQLGGNDQWGNLTSGPGPDPQGAWRGCQRVHQPDHHRRPGQEVRQVRGQRRVD